MTPKSSNTELSEGSYPKPSLAWALFALWLSHIPRYAPSPKDKNPSNPATPEALKFYEMGSKLFETVTYIASATSLLIGGMIYLLYRPMRLAMFSIVEISGSAGWLGYCREHAPDNIPDWVIYSLPDGLWALSYTLFIGALWGFDYRKCVIIAMIIPCIGMMSEILQSCSILPGVFDWCDFIMYLSGGLLGILYMVLVYSSMLKDISNEKKKN